MSLLLEISLPNDYKLNDFLEFHSRDQLCISEKTTTSSLIKGISWEGHPACLYFNFKNNKVTIELAVDDHIHEQNEIKLKALALHMLGLTQSISKFEETFKSHEQIGRLISKQKGLRIPQAATFFEALTWAITGQQISLNAAISIRRKLIQHIGVTHSSGISCYPDAERMARISEDDFRSLGFSNTKAKTLITISKMIVDGNLPIEKWTATRDIEDITHTLLSIKGIGQWTINYTLLRGLGWLDGSLHGDAAVRNKLSFLLGGDNEISEKETLLWLEQFSPWRSLVAAHLWAMEKKIHKCLDVRFG